MELTDSGINIPPEYVLLSTKQTAALLNVTPSKLSTDRHLGKGLPYVKIGGTVRYKLGDIRDYLDRSIFNGEVSDG